MSKKNIIVAAVAVVAIAAGAYFLMGGSSCTAEEYSKKAQNLNADIIKLQQKDPKAFQEAMEKMQSAAMEMASNPDDFSAACKALDEISALVNK